MWSKNFNRRLLKVTTYLPNQHSHILFCSLSILTAHCNPKRYFVVFSHLSVINVWSGGTNKGQKMTKKIDFFESLQTFCKWTGLFRDRLGDVFTALWWFVRHSRTRWENREKHLKRWLFWGTKLYTPMKKVGKKSYTKKDYNPFWNSGTTRKNVLKTAKI